MAYLQWELEPAFLQMAILVGSQGRSKKLEVIHAAKSDFLCRRVIDSHGRRFLKPEEFHLVV